MMMRKITPSVFVDTTLRGCNPGYVVTSDGVVVIDTPQLPSAAAALRERIEAEHSIRYVINTEHHVDHIFGNYYFKGAGKVVHHQGVYDNFMTVYPELDPFEYARAALPDDPDGAGLFPDREEYYSDPNKGDIVFTGDLRLTVGDHTFELLHTPGHTPGQVAVHVPEERVVFTGDSIFNGCQTWLMTSDVDEWLASLDRIRALDVDNIVPGHGPVTDLTAVDRQRAVLTEWKSAVISAIARGWSRDEAADRISFPEHGPVDIGQEHMMDYVQKLNVTSLYDKFTAIPAKVR